jgi:hypothetical protein
MDFEIVGEIVFIDRLSPPKAISSTCIKSSGFLRESIMEHLSPELALIHSRNPRTYYDIN